MSDIKTINLPDYGEFEEVEVKIVWEPPWDKTKMSEAARLELGL